MQSNTDLRSAITVEGISDRQTRFAEMLRLSREQEKVVPQEARPTTFWDKPLPSYSPVIGENLLKSGHLLPNETEPIVLHYKRWMLFLHLFVSLASTIGGLAILFFHAEATTREMIFVGLALPLFSGSALYSFNRLCFKTPALTIDRDGITDNSTAVALGFIPWRDVAGTRIKRGRYGSLLIVYLRNPEAYLREANPLQRLLLQWNSAMVGSIVAIPQSGMPMRLEDLILCFGRYSQLSRGGWLGSSE